jgi:hypothetical protein
VTDDPDRDQDFQFESPEDCTLHTEGVCTLPLWACQTCGEKFCATHWHRTSLGENVECSGCERNRTGHSS